MRHPLLSVAAGLALLLTVGLGSAPPAAASEGVTSTATQTYDFRPAQHLVHVTVDLAVKNTIPSTTTYEPCIQYTWDPYWGLEPYSTTCPHTTNYYITKGSVWVEDSARNLKITADSGSVSKAVSTASYGYTNYTLTFQRTFYGHTRKIRVTYDLPGAAPRTAGGIRAGQAYAYFCAIGNGPDGGTIRIITPTAFSFSHNDSAGLAFSTSQSGGRTVYSSGSLVAPVSAWSCFEGINVSGFASQTVQAPDGRSVIVAAWPEDPAWGAAVAADVRSSLPGIERLVGRPLPGTGSLAILEVGGLGDYGGFYYPDTNIAVINEDFTQPGLTAHELSHAWFNDKAFKSTWLAEGYAQWVGSQNGAASCDRAPAYPGSGNANLEAWSYLGAKSTAAERALVDYQYNAACWVIASVADRIGTARMTAVLAALFDGTSAYGTSTASNTKPATWQAWLDAVDELGMVPAGEADLDLVQNELAQVGVAADRATLSARSSARAAYHELLTTTGWTIPAAITGPLTKWEFGSASKAITTAQTAYADLSAAEDAVPDSAALSSPIGDTWQAARSQADLETVATTAKAERQAAEALVAAQRSLDQADFMATIGLIGTTTAPTHQAAVAALRRGDATAAMSDVDALTAALTDARSAGSIRVALAGGLGLGFAATVIVWRRRRGGRVLAPAQARLVAVASAPETPSSQIALELADVRAELEARPPEGPAGPPAWLISLVSDPESARALLASDGPPPSLAPDAVPPPESA
ncbi:MAG: hypothetical protein HY263_06510 [Chloroflexi bacterium]|nr:hypothetical protein [Chloroflexota bacterium]